MFQKLKNPAAVPDVPPAQLGKKRVALKPGESVSLLLTRHLYITVNFSYNKHYGT